MKTKSIILAILFPLLWILSINLIYFLPIQVAEDFKWFIAGILGSILALLITYIYLRIDKSSFKQIGLLWDSKTLKFFTKGIFIGSLITIIMLGILIMFSDLEIIRNKDANIPMALFWMLAFIPLAFMEELAFRGYAFIKLTKLIGLRYTIIITSILFAYYHDASGATFAHQLLGPGIWGIIYGVCAIWSDGLAVPTGIHVAANIIQGALGMKDDKYAIWIIDYSTEATEAMQTQTNNLGLGIQVLLLIFGIFITEWYIRVRKKKNINVYYCDSSSKLNT